MPQIYTRRSVTPTPPPPARPSFEFVGGNGNANPQRPYVSRRASGIPALPQPQPPPARQLTPPAITDVDDSLVLSDLIRTGETSRLRRRGAMRLDHAARPPPASLGYGGDDEYSYGGQEWREWASASDAGGARGSLGATGTQPDDVRPDTDNEPAYMLFCGAPVAPPPVAHPQPFKPSLLPTFPSTSSHTSSSHPPAAPHTNGCGALIHLRAFSQSPRPLWVGKEEATEVVTSLDAQYFESAVVAKMMKSACGCLRDGIGCAVCGNPLGTRYMPCQAASEGIFSQSQSRTPRQKRRTSRGSVSGARDSNRFYVYTFFADHVSSKPAREDTHYPPIRAASSSQPSSLEQSSRSPPPRMRSPSPRRRGGIDDLDDVFSSSPPPLPASFLAITPQGPNLSRIFTASPRPLSPSLPSSPSLVPSTGLTNHNRPDVPPPILLMSASPASLSRALEEEYRERMRQVPGEEVVLDADGVVLVDGEDTDDETVEGDKVVRETVAWGGR